jgi:hypothetical protein
MDKRTRKRKRSNDPVCLCQRCYPVGARVASASTRRTHRRRHGVHPGAQERDVMALTAVDQADGDQSVDVLPDGDEDGVDLASIQVRSRYRSLGDVNTIIIIG